MNNNDDFYIPCPSKIKVLHSSLISLSVNGLPFSSVEVRRISTKSSLFLLSSSARPSSVAHKARRSRITLVAN